MSTLADIDPTQPLDTELARLGAGRIRTLEDATVNSFGDEHALTGEHAIPRGPTPPTAGTPGRLFINTGLNALQYDNGAVFTTLGGGVTSFETAAVTPNLTAQTGPTIICTLPALLTVHRALLIGSAAVSVTCLSGPTVVSFKWTRGLTLIQQVDYKVGDTAAFFSVPVPMLLDNPGPGTFVYALTVSVDTNTFLTTANPGALYALALA